MEWNDRRVVAWGMRSGKGMNVVLYHMNIYSVILMSLVVINNLLNELPKLSEWQNRYGQFRLFTETV